MDEAVIVKALSNNLKLLRGRLGYSVKKLCIQSGIPQGTFETYLYGKSMMPLDTLVFICNSLNISVDVLLAGLVDFKTEQSFIHKIMNNLSRIQEKRRSRALDLIEPMIKSMIEALPQMSHSSLGQRIRILRQVYGFTVIQLAKACGIEPVTLRCYESSQIMPGLSTFLRLCKGLEISPEYLLCNHVNVCSLGSNKRYYNLLPCHLKGLALTSDRLYNLFYK